MKINTDKVIVSGLISAIFFLCICGTITVARGASPISESGSSSPIVGAIRWDAWFDGNKYEKNLEPKQWHYRLPFYADVSLKGSVTVRSDSQEVMDKEIAYAKDAGLDYWAFVYYQRKPGDPYDRYNYGLRRYLDSTKKSGLNFCLILQGGILGKKEDWQQTVQQLVSIFKEPTYQKVLNGRPLVYMFSAHELTKWAGSEEAAKAALGELDQAAARVGLPETYIVAQGFSIGETGSLANRFGFDAIGAYSLTEKGDDIEYPYLKLAKANRDYWEACRSSAKQVIPIVNAGWDNRPRRTTPEEANKLKGPWYTQPTPGELAIHLFTAMEWIRKYPESTESKTILIYAWNESDEGGWLVPTLAEGNSRLLAVKAAVEME
ncbi:MAG: glycoside hydrolase family 99-like domain-containing protein [Desulfuromonadales bacterium]|nr:glycoside hydrolase family 99-like domain-containing protein [Desulfuromonadales bacterium]